MSYFLIKETIQPCAKPDIPGNQTAQFVAVLTTPEWERERESFDMGIDLDLDTLDIHNTKAEVGIVFIDDSGKAEQMIDVIRRTKRWREPSLERFLHDFLEQIVVRDLSIMERYESELNQIEDEVLSSDGQGNLARVNDIRSDIRRLLVHYEQLIDMTQELEENENGFFSEENLRYIHLFMNYMIRRHSTATSLRDYTIQVRELHNTQLEVRQNKTMTLLTVITTIFMPLTLIAGWYGMNFRYMPELEWRYGYLAVIVLSAAVIVCCLILFKRKKWL